ncbi:hypothetical protein ABGT15_04240 [Flavobacterium enshiense]|uniref:hypothetical protein n=1 Tax=Flavobacterium enshiense TaxID=1341165 RepID=UPI00345CD61B
MKIINFDFDESITADSGSVTADSGSVTADGGLLEMVYSVSFLPRMTDDINLTLRIRHKEEEGITIVHQMAYRRRGLFKVKLDPFVPINDAKYEMVVLNQSNTIIWSGEIMFTTKDVQNYNLNDSDDSDKNYLTL